MKKLATNTSVVLIVALSCASIPGFARAAPGPAQNLSRAQADLDDALRRYDLAANRLAAVEASVSADTARLDALVSQQQELQSILSERARAIYRTGPAGFVEVLVGSASFDEFLMRWDALVRLGRADADAVQRIREARRLVSRAISRLLIQQAAASRALRALEDEKARAQEDLQASRVEYAAYQARVAERERVARAAAQLRASAAATKDAVSVGTPSTPNGAPVAAGGGWKTAVASHYGAGSYGEHLASGYTIGPDSMIVAHKTLPFGTLVEFAYKGRTAVATVADRGPYVSGRTWDLGPGTRRVLGFEGVDEVRYRVLRR